MVKHVNICIADNNEFVTQSVEKIIREILPYSSIDVYEDRKSLTECQKEYQVAILAIELPEIGGIEIGKRLVDNQLVKPEIILLSNHLNDESEVSDLHVHGYLRKPIVPNGLKATLLEISVKLGIEQKFIFTRKKVEYYVKPDEIVAIKSDDGDSMVYTEKGKFESSNSLAKWLGMLPAQFMKAHRAAIVNLKHIKRIDAEEVKNRKMYLSANVVVQVSRREGRIIRQVMREQSQKVGKRK